MKKKAIHVSRSKTKGKGWGLTGTTKAKGSYKTQASAVKRAKSIGRSERRTVAVHGRNGRIQRVVRPYCEKPRNH